MTVRILLLASELAGQEATDLEFFEKRVRPVLVERCYPCHSAGAPKLKAGLRLDSRAAALKGGDRGPALVPGQPAKSLLVEAVSYTNVDLRMPPKGRLPAPQAADIAEWVRRGAPWPPESAAAPAPAKESFDIARRKAEHWAWAPLRRHDPPAVRDGAWVRDPLDAFILAKLEDRGLAPAPPADRRALLRRISFDLVGLPPDPREVEDFAARGDLAVVVDRLLDSPRFGEKWARHWLDLVRYAETRGHEYDYPIANPHHYRDYVIRALNADLAWPDFVAEHVAGDLLPNPRIRDGVNESLLATGWWYLGEWLHSPVDLRADESDRIANQIEVLGKAFLGLTIHCARCHDHKFDAISQRDYYALAGFLKSSSYRQARFDATERDLEAARDLRALRAAFEKSSGGRAPAKEKEVPRGGDLVVDFGASPDLLQDGHAFGILRPGDLLPSGRVVDLAGAWFDPAWNALALAPGTDRDPGRMNWMQAGRTLRTPPFVLTRSTLYSLVRGGGSALAEVDGHRMLEGPLHKAATTSWKDEGLRWIAQNLKDYRSPDAARPLHRIRVEFTPQSDEFAVLRVVQGDDPPAPPDPSPLASADLGEAGRTWIEGRKAVIARIAAPARTAPAISDSGACDEHLLIRGNPSAPAGPVGRRFLEALAGGEPGGGRLELARQLVDPAVTPLLPRVWVNRIWHHLMGRGLVPTVDDFGRMGQAPSHPELLDHLAARFAAGGGSLKKAVRAIVLSSAYAMSGAADARAREIDPANALWHHRPARRLPAEAVRDAMLAVSGRLDPAMFGPPVPVSLDGFQDGRGKPKDGPLDGAGRRTIYLSVRRNFLSSMLLAFDFPQPFTAMGRRSVSNVPAQALILRNNPFVHEQAGVWGRRSLAQPGPVAERIRTMFLAAFARPAAEEEIADAAAFLEELGSDTAAWQALAHALFQAKEFILVP
jgi:hypothetical protein